MGPNKQMRFSFLLLVLLLAGAAGAQETPVIDTGRSVIVHADPRAVALVKKQAAINAAIKRTTTRTMPGYRLLVINTNKREEAIAAKTKVYTHFPDQKAYLVYQTPYFKLKAGNYKTRQEAERYRKDFLVLFPKGVFIINDTIEARPDEEQRD